MATKNHKTRSKAPSLSAKMPNKTKIMAVGDIHGDVGLVKKLAKKAIDEKVDLVIIPGDLTWLNQSTKDLIGPFVKAHKKALLIPGNHEPLSTIDFLSQIYPNTKNIHGYGIKENDLGIFGAGYAEVGPFWVPDKEIFNALKKGHDKIKDMKKKIMVAHSHHFGSKAEFSGIRGSKSVEKAIKEFHPDLVLTSHIHEAGGIEEQIGKTRIINVSRKPVVFEI